MNATTTQNKLTRVTPTHTVPCIHNGTPVDVSQIRTVIESKYLNSRNATLLMHRRDFAIYLHKETQATCLIKQGQKKYHSLGQLKSITDLTYGEVLCITHTGAAFVYNLEKGAETFMFAEIGQVYDLATNMNKTVEDTTLFSVNHVYGTITLYCARSQWKPTVLPIPEELAARLNVPPTEGITTVDFVGPFNKRIVVTSIYPETTDPDVRKVKQFAFKYYPDYNRLGFLKASTPTDLVHTAVDFIIKMLVKQS